MNITPATLRTEYRRARHEGWIQYFLEAAQTFHVRPEILLAIASRETNMGGRQIAPGKFQWLMQPGDNGHGYGLMQIDGRSYPEWVTSGVWRRVEAGILKGADVLAEKRSELQRRKGHAVQVRDSRTQKRYVFTMPKFEGSALERAAIAAYNAGDWAAYHVTRQRSVDFGTTGRNYSSDVLARAVHMRTWLIADKFIDVPPEGAAA